MMRGLTRGCGVLGACAALGALGGCRTAAADGVPTRDAPTADGAFAVVELFTSEGCSSCPPADALLREVHNASRREGRPVYALSFHVDYWNGLGWKDPFSSAMFSERQRAYARAFGREQVYTPQMVVNGTEAFNGSDRAREQRAVSAALAQAQAARVTLRIDRDAERGALRVRYTTSGVPSDARIDVAEVEDGLGGVVERGENAGRTLRHEGVVRHFASVAAAREGTVILPAPDEAARAATSIIAFVELPSMQVVAATRAEPPR